MATQSKAPDQKESTVRRMVVTGVVSIEGTDQGIPGLAVEIQHNGEPPVRLVSTVTGPAGRFSAAITEDQNKKLFVRGLNIQLVILAPERPELARADRIIFKSEVRENAALREVFLVEVPSDLLVYKGLERAVDNARPLAERRAEALVESSKAAEIVSKAANKVTKAAIQKAEKRRRFFNDVVAPGVRVELSNVTEDERANLRYVADEEAIFTRSAQAQHDELVKLRETEKDGTGATIRKVRRRTRLQLDAETLKLLGQDEPDGIVKTVTQEQLESALGVSLDKPTSIQRSTALTDPCRSKLPGEECLEMVEGDTPETGDGVDTGDDLETGGDHDVSGDIGGENVSFDSGTAIAALMDSQTAPEHAVRFGDLNAQLEGRLRADEIATAIGGITLAPGPADVPSFHDFSSLQLAFESVWQEAIDDRILDDV